MKRIPKSLSAFLFLALGAGFMQLNENAYAKTEPTDAQLAACDNTMYFVNCGAGDVNTVPTGYKMGVLQSTLDRTYTTSNPPKASADTTGWAWGVDDGKYYTSKREQSGSSSPTDTLRYVSTSGKAQEIGGNWEYNRIHYYFELPAGSYTVNVGFQIPSGWGDRTIGGYYNIGGGNDNYGGSGTQAIPNFTASTTLQKKSFDVTLTSADTLYLWARNSSASSKSHNNDPVINFIVIKKKIAATKEIIDERIQAIQTTISNSNNFLANPLNQEVYIHATADNGGSIAELTATIDSIKAQNTTGKTAAEYQALLDRLEKAYESLKVINTYTNFTGVKGEAWTDTNGVLIQAHGGQVQKIPGTKGVDRDGRTEKKYDWWWIGEDKSNNGGRGNDVALYASNDLYNWTFQGDVLRTMGKRSDLDTVSYFQNLYSGYSSSEKDKVHAALGTLLDDGKEKDIIVERPKLLFNEQTNRYVIWFHSDGPVNPYTPNRDDSDYAQAAAGVAVSVGSDVRGPYQFIKRQRLHQLPNASDYGSGNYQQQKFRGYARDMNVFKDDDKAAYIAYSSEENRTMFISKLNSSYTDLDKPALYNNDATDSLLYGSYKYGNTMQGVLGKDFTRVHENDSREAPAPFKYNGKYYLITSGTEGWRSTASRIWSADNMLHATWPNYKTGADVFIDDSSIANSGDRAADRSYDSQVTNVICVDANAGKYIYMGDRWNGGKNLGTETRYVWLPISITDKTSANPNIRVKEAANWTLSSLG